MSNEQKSDRATAQKEMTRIFAMAESLGSRSGLVLVIGSFFLYLTGLLPAYVQPETLVGLIGEGVDAYISSQNLPTGWGWLRLLGYSDMLTLGALIWFVLTIVVAFLLMVPVLIRHGERLYLLLVVLQILIFILAGGNFITVGH